LTSFAGSFSGRVLPSLSQWRVAAGVYQQSVRAPPSSPSPSNSEVERDASRAVCFSASIHCQLPDCAAPSSEHFRRGILGGMWSRDYVRGCGWWDTAQRLLPARGKSPARRDKRYVLQNVLGVKAVYLLPVHGSGEKVHGLGREPCSFCTSLSVHVRSRL
jgi:hypothetical protein